jgi:hypothetical protein
MSKLGKLFPFMAWVLFYLAFLVGWLLHPAHLYYELDGRYAEWTILARAQWTRFWHFTAIDPLQGMVTLRMPENPWVHLGSLPLLSGADTLVRHIASYTIYWVEFALATYLLARVIGFSSLVAQVGTQLWLLLAFPPLNLVFGFLGWVMLIPFHVQTIAVGNCLLALFIILGERKPITNALIAIAQLGLTFFYYFAAPLRLISVAPGYLFLGVCVCLFKTSTRTLLWKLGTVLTGGVIALALHVPDYYGALFGHTPRLWEETGLSRVESWGTIDWFFCAMGLFCYSRPFWFSVFYASLLVGGLFAIMGDSGKVLSRPVRIVTIGGAAFYVLMLLIYGLPYIGIWPFGNRFPSPVYVYNPLFAIYCLIVAQLWMGIGERIIQLAKRPVTWAMIGIRGPCAGRDRLPSPTAPPNRPPLAAFREPQVPAVRNLLGAVIPACGIYLAWAYFGGGPALGSLISGLPIARSLRPPPSESALTHFLQEQISVSPGKRFRGGVASYLGSVYGPIRAAQAHGPIERGAPNYLQTMDYLRREHRNSYMYQDLWDFGIPTLEEYGHFISPASWRVFTDLLTEEPHNQVISTTLTYRPSVRIMRGLGVRYLISDVLLSDPDLRLVMRQDAVPRPLTLEELRTKLSSTGKKAPGPVHRPQLKSPPPSKEDRAAAGGQTVASIVSAASSGQLDLLRQLHRSGADIREFGDRALHAAGANGHVHVIRYLHESWSGANLPAKGQELIDAAPAEKKFAVLEYLVTRAGVPLASLREAHHTGYPLYLYELRRPNLANYSPTRVTVIADASRSVQRMRQDDFHIDEEVIVTEPLDGSYVPLSASAMYLEKNILRVMAESRGRSLLLLPVQFSRCWHATSLPDGRSAPVRMVRANLAQTLIEFSGEMRIRLAFHLGFGRATDCRRRDIKELREMRILAGSAPWPRTEGKGAY